MIRVFCIPLLLLSFQLTAIAQTTPPAVAPEIAAAAVPAALAPPPQVLGSEELSSGGQIEITELKRTSGDTVTLKFALTNNTSDTLFTDPLSNGDSYDWNVARITLLDMQNKKKYHVMTDSDRKAISSRGDLKSREIKQGQKARYWAKYQAPPATVTKITVEVPNVPPFEDLPISQ